MTDAASVINQATPSTAASVSADSLINSLKRRVHAFVEHHTILEALVEEKDVLLGQKQQLIQRLQERLAYYEQKYASLEQDAQAKVAAIAPKSE